MREEKEGDKNKDKETKANDAEKRIYKRKVSA